MSNYQLGWIITHDYQQLNTPNHMIDPNAQGSERFRIRDDNVLYYEGRLYDDNLYGFEPLQWAACFVGATSIEYYDETIDEWRVL